MIILGTGAKTYRAWRDRQEPSKRNNGAYYYAKEIEDIILPALKDLPVYINTVGATLYNSIPEGAVIVCHDNRNTISTYSKFFRRDVTWICSKVSTRNTLTQAGEKAVYVPLSVDTGYVKQYKLAPSRKNKKTAYVGNAWSFKKQYLEGLDKKIVQLSGLERDELLKSMAKYGTIIAEGRCLIEAQILGAKVKLPDYVEHEAVMVDVLDSKDAIQKWRSVLEEVPPLYRVKMLHDIYPYCIGDTPLMNSEELEDITNRANRRRIEQAYVLL